MGLAFGITQDRNNPPLMTAQTLHHVPTMVTSLSLNDNGWGVWTSGRQDESQVFLWDGKNVRALGIPGRNNRDAKINLKNWVVWSANREGNTGSTDIFLWKGKDDPICLSANCLTAAEPALNDQGDVVWWGDAGGKNKGIADVFYLPAGARTPFNVTEGDRDGASRNPRINDAGYISYERSTQQKGIAVTNLVYLESAHSNRRRQVTNSSDLNVTNGGINAASELVYEQYDDAAKQWQIWKYKPNGTAYLLTKRMQGNSHLPSLNAAGTVAWHTDMRGKSELFWYDGRETAPIPVPHPGNYTRPVAINSHGTVLYASGDGSGTGFDILLAAPDKRGGNTAVFLVLFALCSGVLISILRGDSPKRSLKLPH